MRIVLALLHLFLLFNLNCFANTKLTEPFENVIIKSPSLDDPKTPHFQGLDITFITNNAYPDENLKRKLLKLNPDRNESTLLQENYWDINLYNKINLPLIVGTIENQELFSSKSNGHGLRFLDLPIYMPHQGWKIPPQLEQFRELIEKLSLASVN